MICVNSCLTFFNLPIRVRPFPTNTALMYFSHKNALTIFVTLLFVKINTNSLFGPQALPLPANSVSSKPLLLIDNIAVIVAKAWPVQIAVWDGECSLLGPVPVLYAEQPEQVRSELEQYPERFSAEVNRFMTR